MIFYLQKLAALKVNRIRFCSPDLKANAGITKYFEWTIKNKNNVVFFLLKCNLQYNNMSLYYVTAHEEFRYGLDTALVRRRYGAIPDEFLDYYC